jgi:hypothetical protein
MDVEQEIRDIWNRLDNQGDEILDVKVRIDNLIFALEKVLKEA